MDKEQLLEKNKKKDNRKGIAFAVVGIITFAYCVLELYAALYIDSLTLLSDGFHNLSDVVSLYIAFWAQKAAKRDLSDEMSYGWARTEVLGGLTNGCFLLSLCLYVALEAIPKFIRPQELEGGMIFMGVAALGLLVNTFGTVVFAVTGLAHHGHSHGHDHGHDHSHGHKHKHEDNHEHGHKEKKDGRHAIVDPAVIADENNSQVEEMQSPPQPPKKKHKHRKGGFCGMDVNIGAVFIHYLGDAVSSLFVLGTGAIIQYVRGKWWTVYIDPVSSLLIVALIVSTTIPLVKRCSMILLQSVPSDINLEVLRSKLSNMDGVVSMHDLHVWQLVDGMTIASVHIACEEGIEFGNVLYQAKKIFHDNGIHSATIQPELLSHKEGTYCEQNCVAECKEDWCCKKTADRGRELVEQYSTFNEII